MTETTKDSTESAGTGSGFLRAKEVNTKRALIFYATGAVVGLIIGGYGLFTARGTTTNVVPPADLALVNGVPVLRSDFVIQLETETGIPFDQATRKDKLRVLDEMVREELLVQRGLELDFAETDQSARNALVNAVEQQAVAQVTTGKVTEDELRAEYNAHPEDYSTEGIMTVHNYLVPVTGDQSDAAAKQTAEAAAKALRAGTPPDKVADQFNLKKMKFYDKDFYFAAKIHLGKKLYAAVVDMKAGQVSDPVRLDDGYHVVTMDMNRVPVPLSFERARSQVLGNYVNKEQATLMNNTVSFLRNRSKILIADDYKNDYKPEEFKVEYQR